MGNTGRRRIEAEIIAAERQMDLGEDIDWEEPPPDQVEELWHLRSWAMRFQKAAGLVRRRYDEAVAHDLGEGGVARFGDEFLRYSAPSNRQLTDGGRDWLRTLTVDEVLEILPHASKFRITGLENVAKRRGLDVDTLEGSFYVDQDEHREPRLTSAPISLGKAPKYADAMESGEVRRRT